ncbi:2-isopropylmalate synthase [Escherichia coli]|nr:2-isopropylmalate synthase [Escherichia coli]
MTNYSLRARMMILILAPTVLIGLLLSIFFVVHRYNDLQRQLEDAGASIIEPLAVSTEYGMSLQNRESIGQLISVLHRRHSDIVRAISVYDENNRLFVTSNFHLDPSSMQLGSNVPFPRQLTVTRDGDIMILRTPIISESYSPDESPSSDAKNSQNMLGYIALELDLKSVRLQQYKEIFISSVMMLFCIGIALIFGWRLMRDVTGPIRNMVNTVDRIRRGQLDSRVEGFMLGELDMLKNGINSMAMSLAAYHEEMQHNIDQATSDLRETLEQMEIQNVELDLAKKRAQEAARIKSEFLANMSHELRTPLNGVIGFTRLTLKTELTPTQRDHLNTIERSANNLLAIINDVLDFSKLEAGKLILESIPFPLRSTLDEVIERAIYMVKRARNYTDDVEFSCEDAGRTPIADLARVVEAAINAGATTINIPDTVGYTMPFEFAGIISGLYERVPNIDKAIISVHTHDDLGLAVGNSLAAVHAGARQVEGAMNGIGERAGNCSLEEVIMAIKVRKDILNVHTAINHQEIWRTSQLVSQICNMPIPANKAIVGSGAFAHSSGIHQDGVLKNRENYEIMTPESIGLNQIQLNLTSRSGRAAVKHRMDEMGYKESEYNLDNLYDAFLKLADKKGQVFDYDLEALAFIGKQQEEPEHFRLDYFSVQSGSNDIATAAVKLACGEEVKAEAANGNGPVDAVYQAINRITEYNVELVKYSLTAKGHGKDALGQVDIVANYNGRRFHGVGLATDIVESSAKAMVHVLNNIWRAAEVEKELQRKAQHNENNKETV